jgi:hypothetical protein
MEFESSHRRLGCDGAEVGRLYTLAALVEITEAQFFRPVKQKRAANWLAARLHLTLFDLIRPRLDGDQYLATTTPGVNL